MAETSFEHGCSRSRTYALSYALRHSAASSAGVVPNKRGLRNQVIYSGITAWQYRPGQKGENNYPNS